MTLFEFVITREFGRLERLRKDGKLTVQDARLRRMLGPRVARYAEREPGAAETFREFLAEGGHHRC